MSSESDQAVYAAAQGRSWLRGELEGADPEYVHQFAGMVQDPETLDLLNYYCSLWAQRGEDFLGTELCRTILSSAATETYNRAFQDGNASVLQGGPGLVNNDGDAADALTEIVDRLANEGTIAVVVGPPGAGKTSLTLDVNRAWAARTGGALIGNTGWDAYDDVVHSDVAMLEAMASVEGPALGTIDETVQSLTGRGADSKEAETFTNRMTLIRKEEEEHGPHPKRGSLMAVAHNWSRMNAPTRRMTTLVIQKPSRKDPSRVVLWESDGGEDNKEKIGEFTGLTDTRESYPEHEASEFEVVLDDADGDDDGDDSEQVAWDKDCETAIRAVLRGDNQTEAAKLTDFGRGWVGDRWREWKDGEHREKVPLPATLPDHVAAEEVKGT